MTWAGWLFRWIVAILIVLATGLAWVVTAAANWTYGISKGTPREIVFGLTSQMATAGVNVAVDAFAALLAIALVWFYRDRAYLAAALTFLACLFLSAYSFSNTLGFMAMERADARAGREHKDDGRKALEKKLTRLEEQRKWVAESRPAETLAALISKAEGDAIYARTGNCDPKKTSLTESVTFCNELSSLRVELANAGRRASLDGDIESTNRELQAGGKVVVQDGLAGMVHDVIGIAPNKTEEWHPLAGAFAALLLATFGLAWAELVVGGVPTSAHANAARAPVREAAQASVPAEIEQPAPSTPAVIELSPLTEAEVMTAMPAFAGGEALPEVGEGVAAPTPSKSKDERQVAAMLAPARNVAKLKQKAISAEEGLAQWAQQYAAGEHFLADLQADYVAYAERRKIPAIRKHSVGTELDKLGYARRKQSSKGGKVSFRFPASPLEEGKAITS